MASAIDRQRARCAERKTCSRERLFARHARDPSCDFAGIEPPKSNEGLSYRPVLSGQRATLRDTLYGAYCGGSKPGMRCVRKGDWKLIKYDVLDGKVRETQLFNLAENPHEFLDQHTAEEVRKLSNASPTASQRNLANGPPTCQEAGGNGTSAARRDAKAQRSYRLWSQPDDGLETPQPRPRKNRGKKKGRPNKAASEKAASEKAASEKAASEKAASEKAASEKAASEKGRQREGPLARRPPARRPLARRPPARRPLARRPPARRPLARRPLAEKAASEKAASEKAASEKAASEKAGQREGRQREGRQREGRQREGRQREGRQREGRWKE